MLTKTEVRALTERLAPEFEAIGKKLGWNLKIGSGSFGDTFTFKVEASKIQADGSFETREAADFKRLGRLFGFQPDDLGAVFHSMGDSYRISGLKTKSPKRNLLAVRIRDGKTFVFQAQAVARILGRRDPASVECR